ncbi:MAG: hypothetical protein ACI9W4_000609 [Rhodothermales bacterium]|jgi:hypothetical protein
MSKPRRIILGISAIAAAIVLLITIAGSSVDYELAGMLLGGIAFVAITLFLMTPHGKDG